MERKIGEIFEYNGEWYQCVKSPDGSCKHCDMDFEKCPIPVNECTESGRSDKSYVIFKKLEKVGEPYMLEDKKFQMYRVFRTPYIYHKIDCSGQSFVFPYYDCVSLEIKQTKEDMEEKKLNLKPFDLQKAKAGKPVCTRDGRKARIICFDRINGDYYKIVACVTAFDGDFEEVLFYGIDGYIVDSQNPKDEDLMILPEKKEGWILLRKDGCVFDSEEVAKKNCTDDYFVAKVEWEE